MKLTYAFSVSAVLIIVLIMLYSNEKKEPTKLKQLHMEGGEESLNLGLAAKLKDVEMIEPRPQLVEHNDTRNSLQKVPLKLSSEIMEGVKKFVFFVGYSRSGHSILGTILDAHPHVVIANEFFLFKKFASDLERAPEKTWTANLMNKLYQKSVFDPNQMRASEKKGYTLNIDGLWQGNFDRHIEVIGDKSGGWTTMSYLRDKVGFKKNYQKLKDKLSMPIRIIHGLRNPFDMIATRLAIGISTKTFRQLKQKPSNTKKLHMPSAVERGITTQFRQIAAVVEMIDTVLGPENVLEVHNCDLVNDPRNTISKLFDFLDVETSEHFLDTCSDKIFKSTSRSRDLIEWSPKQVSRIEQKMKKYKMLSRYNFTSD